MAASANWSGLVALAGLAVIMLAAGCAPSADGEPNAVGKAAPRATVNEELGAYLAEADPSYSEELGLLGLEFSGPGYHTTVPDGTWTHPTRQSIEYAVCLLERNAEGDVARAEKVIRSVLALQDTNRENATFGIWPWLYEEPLEKMSPPDWNWADFIGAQIAQALVDYPHLLSREVQQQMRTSLSYAAEAIRKRNVGPGYTNIAIMGGGVCAAAGELLDDEEMLEYGRKRLENVVEYARENGSFAEYNSPTYTRVALEESERTLHLVKDRQAREAAETLRQIAWEVIAESWHPATAQWGGPHSRAYSDLLRQSEAAFLEERIGMEIPVHPREQAEGKKPRYSVTRSLPCPDRWMARFRGLPEEEVSLTRTFQRGDTEERRRTGTTWHTGEVCLGSINRSMLWTQRRPLIGYLRTEQNQAVVLRARFLKDGKDFASMAIATDQDDGRAVSVYYPLRNRGDWHPSLDRPADGRFSAEDFRVRYELEGKGAEAAQLEEGLFALRAGNHQVLLHTMPGHFEGEQVEWEVSNQGNRVCVDGICHRGVEKEFDFELLPSVRLGAALEIIPRGAATGRAALEWRDAEDGALSLTWPAAELAAGAPGQPGQP